MYLAHWNLSEFPFDNVPNPRFFYRSHQHEEALLRLLYATEHQKGAALLTGEVGSGKTIVSRAFMAQLSQHQYQSITVVNPDLSSMELIKTITLKMGMKPNSDSKSLLLEAIQDRAAQNAQRGLKTVLIVDEAHVIQSRSTFEHLRMLLNMQSEDRFLITVILMGQPPLLKKISALRPLEERIAIKYHMTPFNFRDTVLYVLHRLKKAGATKGIFTKESCAVVYEYSKGIPLRINNLCDRCLLIGLMRRAKLVDSKLALDAIKDIQ